MDQDKKNRLHVAQEREKLSVLGQESDLKAKKWIEEEFTENERRAKIDWETDMYQLLKLKKGNPKYYFRYLAGILMKFASEEEIPKKYRIEVSLTDQGIVLKITGTKYQGAFKPTGLPSFDRNACKVLAVRLGTTIAKLEGYVRTTEGGIVLPDQEDYARITGNS